MSDFYHKKINYKASEAEHKYGKQVHLISDPYLMTQLARLCSKDTYQPLITELVQSIYRHLLRYIVNIEFPRCEKRIETRMIVHNPEGVFEGEIIDPDTRVVVVNLARAGAVPALETYQQLNYLLNPQSVRQDHIYVQRSTDERESVIGAHVSGYKIGGSIEGSIVYIPDPMGATGSTLETAYELYKNKVQGKWKKIISAHLVIAPEFLRKILKICPDIIIYAIRLDRGLSDPEILQTIPGTKWDQERGLNERQYIVPGAGGLGEILNNSFV
ncbi:MAG: uracil phosphoribosyltransferase [Deltaproteobacteria bacterium RIFCSPHIGHO2_12_FULL_43_9]|nr:MAG: uracil phosphoribosyltransferase [Deltaproteobacteria bacterium RIFCSPHIGHO2_12_FULL_43_9]